MQNTVYRRADSDWLSAHKVNHSISYWRSQARHIFATFPQVEEIEVVTTGRKVDSSFISRGKDTPARNQYVIIASTGGKWGKSRRDYPPNTTECKQLRNLIQ